MAWERKAQPQRKRSLPTRASKPIRAQMKAPSGKPDLGWTGGKAGS
jgi:hypothetical protein